MLTEKELEAAIRQITDRLDEVNQLYIKKIATQLLKIGELNATSINRLIVMSDMGAGIQEITVALSRATAMNVRDLYAIYQAALDDVYTDPRFREVLQRQPLPPEQNARITQLVQNISTQTAQAMINLSNTTAVADAYKDAIDRAITATAAGLTSYQEAARDIIRELGYSMIPAWSLRPFTETGTGSSRIWSYSALNTSSCARMIRFCIRCLTGLYDTGTVPVVTTVSVGAAARVDGEHLKRQR